MTDKLAKWRCTSCILAIIEQCSRPTQNTWFAALSTVSFVALMRQSLAAFKKRNFLEAIIRKGRLFNGIDLG